MSDNVTEECRVILENFTIPNVTTDFINTPSIRFIKDWGHRYGFTDNITAVITGEEDGLSYLKGLLATNITFFIIFVVWIVVVLILQCVGPKNASGFSGKIQIQPKPVREDYINKDDKKDEDEENEEDHNNDENKEENGNHPTDVDTTEGDYDLYQEDLYKWEEHYRIQKRNHKIAVWTIVVSALCIITCALLMSIMGVQSLVKSAHSGIDALGHVQDLTVRGVDIIDAALESETLSGGEILQFLEGINLICGGDERICTSITNVTTCDFDGLDEIINGTIIKDFTDRYNSKWDALFDDLRKTRVDLIDIYNAAGKLSNNVQSFNWAFQIARVFALLLACLCILIIHGVLCTEWRFIYKWLRRCFLIPLLVILVSLCYLFSLIFVMGSKSLADVCYNSPDPEMLLLLNRFKSSFSPFLYNVLVFYINQCPHTGAAAELDEFVTYLLAAVKQIFAFITTIATLGNEGVKAICQGNQGDAMATSSTIPPEFQQPVIRLGESAQIRICELVAWILAIREFFQCGNWHPLYSNTVWDAMCFNGTDGFLYVSASQLGIVFFSMVLLTARVGFFEFPTVKGNDDSNGEDLKDDNESNNLKEDDEKDLEQRHSTEESTQEA